MIFYRILLIILIIQSLPAREIVVSSSGQLEEAIADIRAGDTVWVNDGSYYDVGSLTLRNINGTENPVLISTLNNGKAHLYGESYFDLRQCSNVTIRGFLFTSTDVTVIKLQASSYIRITQNIFRLNETESLKWIVVGGIWDDPNAVSHHNRIDHNLFEEKHKPGNFITIDGSPDPVYKSSQYDRIDHNHFRNNGPRVQNEMESIRVGWSELSLSSGYTLIEYNLFENCDGDPEFISIKTCDDTVRYNTFLSCQGTLSLRHGNRSVVEANFFFGDNKEGTGGVRLYGNDHRITNNYFQDLTGTRWDAAITLTNADYDGGSSLSRHFRINRALISHNTLINNAHNIEIGFTNSGNYTKPPRDVVISNNVVAGFKNELIAVFSEPVNMHWESNIMFAGDSAVIGPSFDSTEVYFCDPLLSWDETHFKPNSASIILDYLPAPSMVETDIDGQLRDSFPDAGCDEVAFAVIKNRPLTPFDVGPEAATIATSIRVKTDKIPQSYDFGLYPNPFNSSLYIHFNSARAGFQNLKIYDINGRLIKDFSGSFNSGENQLAWNAQNVSSGLYLIKLNSEFRKALLIK